MPYLGNTPTEVPLSSADILDSAITSAKIANGTIAIADFSATGTPSASTFLRGDNSWGSAGASAGQVIQVVTASASAVNITSTTDVTTNITASITPSSASNKILILITSVINFTATGRANDFCGVNLKRGSTSLIGGGNNDFASVYSVSTHTFNYPIAISYVDSPNTTSATTYELFSRIQTSGEAVYWNNGIGGRITLLEIKG